jgi:hypothetical protein
VTSGTAQVGAYTDLGTVAAETVALAAVVVVVVAGVEVRGGNSSSPGRLKRDKRLKD